MASGPFHYSEAERLLDLAETPGMTERWARTQVATEAGVHALLALAAATALGRESGDGTMPGPDRTAWFDVASERRKAGAS